jgi:hypothetical protein
LRIAELSKKRGRLIWFLDCPVDGTTMPVYGICSKALSGKGKHRVSAATEL